MTETEIFKKILGEFYDKLQIVKSLVPRHAQFPKAEHKIKVAMGMRRAGKTYFLYQKILDLLNEGVPLSRILYINFEDDRLLPLTRQRLANLIDAFYAYFPDNHDVKCYLFFDEIQVVEDWPIVIRRMQDTKNAEIFLTGSSAKLLSTEIATNLRGRSLSIEIWPFSFAEYCQAKKQSIDVTLFDQKTEDRLVQLFSQYLTEGGFPEVVLHDPASRQQVLQEYFEIALYRDIIERHEISQPMPLKYLFLSVIQNVARPFSVNKFYHDLKSQGHSLTKDALYSYTDYIMDAYMGFFVPLYDLSVRKMQTNPKKTYAIDPGFVRALTLNYDHDRGRLFENVVFLDLKRRGLKVFYYFTQERYEIDFLVQNGRGEKKFFQVVWDMDDPKTKERELRALEAGMKEQRIDGEIVTLRSYLENGLRGM